MHHLLFGFGTEQILDTVRTRKSVGQRDVHVGHGVGDIVGFGGVDIGVGDTKDEQSRAGGQNDRRMVQQRK